MNSDSITFLANESTAKRLDALSKYYHMISEQAKDNDDIYTEALNFDGIINALLDDVLSRRIKDIIKRHSFEDDIEFVDGINSCRDDAECKRFIESAEKRYYIKSYNKILEHMPVIDNQKVINFPEQKQKRA